MTTELALSAGIVPLNRSAANPLRRDRPSLPAGTQVWWNSGVYRVDSVEFQGQRWCAVLLREADWGQAQARAWFAPVSELTPA
jgi:hypothetical protein